jgi:heterodisulfide reductase subunit A
MSNTKLDVDALVVGGGIAGMQASLDLADQGYQVALVEKAPSIGGKMIALSKVFPTLDCCSCITTPKMAAAAHHENIQLFTDSEVQSVDRDGDGFTIQVIKKPRYIIEEDCTGCRSCELVCPLDLPDEENEFGRTSHRVIYVPFTTAVPQIALIDIEYCLFCGKCIKACPTDAIDFNQQPKTLEIELRPSDGKQPDSIAYVQCAGSRDLTLGVPYCSRICCMYAIKQAMLLAGALPMADITIYYMDIRAFGKGYEQFYQNSKAMGIEFVKGKVAVITEDENQTPIVKVELIDEGSKIVERSHDLVVLSEGMLPGYNPEPIYGVPVAEDGFVQLPSSDISPTLTSQDGIFATGTSTGPMDIVDTIMTAGAAASQAAIYIHSHNGSGDAITADTHETGERSEVNA